MNSRPEDVLRGERQNGSINYLHVAVTESRTKTAIRTGFLLAHSLRMYISSLRRGVGGWSADPQSGSRVVSVDSKLTLPFLSFYSFWVHLWNAFTNTPQCAPPR